MADAVLGTRIERFLPSGACSPVVDIRSPPRIHIVKVILTTMAGTERREACLRESL